MIPGRGARPGLPPDPTGSGTRCRKASTRSRFEIAVPASTARRTSGEPRLVNQLSLGEAPQPGPADHLPAQGFAGVGQVLQERGIVFVRLFTAQPDTAIRAAN